ncbi:MAG TPA: cytidylate kinase-like family protein [Gaiellaceae bacterium]
MVCVSHATGSGGEEIGKQVAQRLDYLYVDEEIVARAAAQGGLEPRDIADEEHRRSFAGRILEVLAEQGGDAWAFGAGVTAAMESPRPADIRALIRETVVQTAARGRVVIVAHAASYAVEPDPAKLRVLVTASPTTRAERVGAQDTVDDSQAVRMVKAADAGRRDYLKRFYGVDRESPTDYDLVINTDVLSTAQAADIISQAAGQ